MPLELGSWERVRLPIGLGLSQEPLGLGCKGASVQHLELYPARAALLCTERMRFHSLAELHKPLDGSILEDHLSG